MYKQVSVPNFIEHIRIYIFFSKKEEVFRLSTPPSIRVLHFDYNIKVFTADQHGYDAENLLGTRCRRHIAKTDTCQTRTGKVQ